MICVLLVAAGASWEGAVLGAVAGHRDLAVLKRCVDIDDLLASAAAGQADAAVISVDAPGLDASSVDRLRRQQVRPIGVVDTGAAGDQGRAHASRIGIQAIVETDALERLPAVLLDDDPDPPRSTAADDLTETAGAGDGPVIVVWGAQGAPGRTTIASAIAAELAHRTGATTLVDADPYGGAVAQQLGVLDEVSGLLAAARLASTGSLAERVAGVPRDVGGGLAVVTGLPRADRWVEVRPGALEALLGALRPRGPVVVDTGFCLEPDPSAELAGRPSRNGLTLAALGTADQVVVVGTPDPVGLSRLARGLVDLRETVGPRSVWVVVNRQRASLGWSEADVISMVRGFGRVAEVYFFPDDPIVDRALVSGHTIIEVGDSPLRHAVSRLVTDLVPTSPASTNGRRIKRRTAGRGRRG